MRNSDETVAGGLRVDICSEEVLELYGGAGGLILLVNIVGEDRRHGDELRRSSGGDRHKDHD
jgi:hypothetical protein